MAAVTVGELLAERRVYGGGAVRFERLPRGWCVDGAKVAALLPWRDRAAMPRNSRSRWCVAVYCKCEVAGAS